MDGWLRLASHLNMPLEECRAKTKYLHYLVWLEWLRKQWNEPSRSDYYLMAIARSALQSRADLAKFKIEFGKPEIPEDYLIEELVQPAGPVQEDVVRSSFAAALGTTVEEMDRRNNIQYHKAEN